MTDAAALEAFAAQWGGLGPGEGDPDMLGISPSSDEGLKSYLETDLNPVVQAGGRRKKRRTHRKKRKSQKGGAKGKGKFRLNLRATIRLRGQ